LRMITAPYSQVAQRAERLAGLLGGLENVRLEVECVDHASRTGGGALPRLEIPTRCVRVRIAGQPVNAVEQFMRGYAPPVIGRIESDGFLMDPRTLAEDELPVIAGAFRAFFGRGDA